MNKLFLGDNLAALELLGDNSIDLIYIDPPFASGKTRMYTQLKTTADIHGDRTGFGNKRYTTTKRGTQSYPDKFTHNEYYKFMLKRLTHAVRILKPTGSIFLHLDYREVYNCKIFLMDKLFGPDCFKNEIIWSFDYGGRPKNKWPVKHNTILWYTKDPEKYTFNWDEVDRIPYMAPKLVGEDKAAEGKKPTSVWWGTIVPTNGKERTGYPTQKPLWLLKRIVTVHSNPGDVVLDFFCGSGTCGVAAAQLKRKFILVDNNPEAIKVCETRLKKYKVEKTVI